MNTKNSCSLEDLNENNSEINKIKKNSNSNLTENFIMKNFVNEYKNENLNHNDNYRDNEDILNINLEKINNISEESKQFKNIKNIFDINDENLTNLKTLLQKKRKNFTNNYDYENKNHSFNDEENYKPLFSLKENENKIKYDEFLKNYFEFHFDEKENNENVFKSLSFNMKDIELNESSLLSLNENNENNDKNKIKNANGIKIIGLVN